MYTITFYDHDGNLYLTLTGWDRLEYTQRLNYAWSHSIQVRVHRQDSRATLLRSIPRDYFVIITRQDRITGETSQVYEGLHQTCSEQVQMSGDIFFNLYGVGYTKFLERRLCYPPVGLENDQRSGPAETLMKGYVNANCVERNRLPGFSVAAGLGRGNTTEYTARYVNLFSSLETLSANGGLYFGVEGGPTLGTFVFDARPLWGLDRREGTANATVFDMELGNMTIPILSTNHRLECNHMVVGGAGTGLDRKILEYGDFTMVNASPWSRSELFVEASEEETDEALLSLALQTIKERGVQVNFSFDMIENVHTRWLRDWGLGDYVTAKYEGLRFDKMLESVTAVVTSSESSVLEETLSVELTDVLA
jgi:hypothetical protein